MIMAFKTKGGILRFSAAVWLWGVCAFPVVSLGEQSFQTCDAAVQRHIVGSERLFVRVMKTFKSTEHAEAFMQDVEEKTGRSFHEAYCPFGLDVMDGEYFESNVAAVYEYQTRDSDTKGFQYLELNLCFQGKDEALSAAGETGANYIGFHDPSQCHYVGWNSVWTREQLKERMALLKKKGLDKYVELFPGDVWIVMGKAVTDDEEMRIKELAASMGLETETFRDTIYLDL